MGAYAAYFRQPMLGPRLWEFLCFAFSFAMFISGLALFAQRRLYLDNGMPFGPKQLGYIWAFAGFLGILLQGPAMGRLVKRFGERLLNRVGFAGYAVGYFLLAFCHSVPVLIVSTVICSIGGLVRPTLTSLITQAASREEQGVVLGLTQSLNSVAQIAAPLLAGYLIERGVLTGWGVTAAAVSALGLILASRATPTTLPVDVRQ